MIIILIIIIGTPPLSSPVWIQMQTHRVRRTSGGNTYHDSNKISLLKTIFPVVMFTPTTGVHKLKTISIPYTMSMYYYNAAQCSTAGIVINNYCNFFFCLNYYLRHHVQVQPRQRSIRARSTAQSVFVLSATPHACKSPIRLCVPLR